jgi:hypothetical protein
MPGKLTADHASGLVRTRARGQPDRFGSCATESPPLRASRAMRRGTLF